MFKMDCTSSIIEFINSLFRSGKKEEHSNLANEAIEEVRKRVPLMAKCYDEGVSNNITNEER